MRMNKETIRELSITGMGHRGDGLGVADGEPDADPIYVPFTLPGERVTARIEADRGTLVELIEASADRIEPICRHFQTCGGCLLQHMARQPYLEFKRATIVSALTSHGLDAPVETPLAIQHDSRRRAVLSARRLKNGQLAFGFSGRRSHEIIAIEMCPILVPELASRLDDLRGLAAIACGSKQPLKLHATATETGIDVLLVDGKQDENTRQRLAQEALRRSIARVSFPGDIIVETIAPSLTIAGITVKPAPGLFLQAAAESETLLGDLAVEALRAAKPKTVADLFCGLGAFTLRIAQFAKVAAVDLDQDALKSLDHALRFATGLKPVKPARRDLFRNPLTSKELNLFDAVLFDPPRAGADRQARELAQSKVKTVIAISCNPQTLARDLATLVDGGYGIRTIRPVDQFVFSPHIEIIAICEKKA